VAELIGFEEPAPCTVEQWREAVMFGRFLLRDENGSYFKYQGNVYMMPKAPFAHEQKEPAP
jgi:hypothetical protein